MLKSHIDINMCLVSIIMHPYLVICVYVCVCAFLKANNENAAITYPSIQCNCIYKVGTEIIIT